MSMVFFGSTLSFCVFDLGYFYCIFFAFYQFYCEYGDEIWNFGLKKIELNILALECFCWVAVVMWTATQAVETG